MLVIIELRWFLSHLNICIRNPSLTAYYCQANGPAWVYGYKWPWLPWLVWHIVSFYKKKILLFKSLNQWFWQTWFYDPVPKTCPASGTQMFSMNNNSNDYYYYYAVLLWESVIYFFLTWEKDIFSNFRVYYKYHHFECQERKTIIIFWEFIHIRIMQSAKDQL